MAELLILVTSLVISVVIGSLVFVRNPKSRVNQVYGILTVLLVLFSLANHMSLRRVGSLIYVREVILLANLVAAALYVLLVYLGGRATLQRKEKIGLGFTALVAVLDMTPAVFAGLTGGDKPVPQPNFGAPLFALQMIIFFAASCALLLRRIRSSRGAMRLQYTYLLVGVAPFLILAPVTGFALPVILKNSSLVFLSPAYGVFFVCLVGYAIVKHKLFDIRAAVARLLGYVLSLAALAAAYGFVVFLLAQYFLDLQLSVGAKVFLSSSMAVIALAFHPFKKMFDRLTTKIFYQDMYDPQELFDRLNKLLVSSLDMGFLMRHSSSIIAEYLKPTHCLIGLSGHDDKQRLFGDAKRKFSDDDFTRLLALTAKINHNVIVTDDLEERYAELKEILRANDVAVVVQLSQNVRRNEEGLGYIALGLKKSGNPYSMQDVRTLEAVANELVLAIQNAMHFEEIQNFNVSLQSRVDDATRKLRRTNEKLKALDETKDDFISMASHQLRTPLTSVKGYLSMVLEGDAGEINETQQKMLGQAFISSQRMVYLIADLLNVSRLRTGKFVIEQSPTNLAHMVSEELNQLVEAAAAKGVTLTYDQPKQFPDMMLDETKTRQVIMNFADNAIYYTPTGGHIKVELRDTPTSVELRVVDDGIGVPKTEQHHLFTKFYRAANARKARPDGTGLGLFMAKKVVLAQGGSILFESKEGKGSTFGFLFPKTANHQVRPMPVQEPVEATKS